MAITNGHTELAKFLGAAGADPNLTNAQGKAAVYGAPEELLNELLKAPQRDRGSAPLMTPRASSGVARAPAQSGQPAPRAAGPCAAVRARLARAHRRRRHRR